MGNQKNTPNIIFFARHVSMSCIVILLYLSQGYAQDDKPAAFVGKIMDANAKPISFANVMILRSVDSTMLGAVVSGADGGFRLKTAMAVKVILFVTRIGFKDFYKDVTTASDSSEINLGNTALIADNKTLEAVVVRTKKPLLEFKTDRTVLNVANSINATGSTALELLRKAPGVRIGNSSDIILNGKSGVTVYVDGKLSYLTGSDLVDLLNTMQSSGIEAIEIIDKPSSKYDAAGSAGVINIKTKKNTGYGFNAAASAGVGFGSYNPKYDGGINLNYRQKGYNLFGSFNYFRSNNKDTSQVRKIQYADNNLVEIQQQFNEFASENGHLYKAGIDLFVSKQSTVGFSVNGRRSTPDSYIDGKSFISQVNYNDSLLISRSSMSRKNTNAGYNLNYRYADTSGREFSIDADYNQFSIYSDSYQPNFYYDKMNVVSRQHIYLNNASGDYRIYSFKSDYQARFAKGILTTGLKYSDVNSDNSLLFYNMINAVKQPDSVRTNSFSYHEKISAAYLMYNISSKKLQFQFGTRLEHTNVVGILTTLAGKAVQTLDTSYLQLFPNVQASYNINNKNTIGLSFYRRIDRPGYADLNPFEFVIDELSYYKGNSFLKPQFTNTYSLTYQFNQKWSVNFAYSKFKNYIARYADTLPGRKVYETVVNLAERQLYDFTISYKISVHKWLESNVSFNAYHEQNKGTVLGKQLEVSRMNYGLSTGNTFILSPVWSMELSGYYVSKFLNGANYIYDPQWTIDMGIQNKILKERAVLRLAVTDIFNTLKVGIDRNFGGLNFHLNRQWETRQIKLSLNYKFGNRNVKQAQERGTSADEEKSRVH